MRLAAANPRVDFNMDNIFAEVRIIFLYFIPHSLEREREMSRCFLLGVILESFVSAAAECSVLDDAGALVETYWFL